MELWELVLKMKESVVKTNKTKLSPLGPHDNRPHEMSVLIASSSLDPCVNVSQKLITCLCFSTQIENRRYRFQSNGMSEMTRKTMVFHLRRSFMRCLFLLLGTC